MADVVIDRLETQERPDSYDPRMDQALANAMETGMNSMTPEEVAGHLAVLHANTTNFAKDRTPGTFDL